MVYHNVMQRSSFWLIAGIIVVVGIIIVSVILQERALLSARLERGVGTAAGKALLER